MSDGVLYCNRCGTQNSALAKFCANCGTPLATEAGSTMAGAEVVPRAQGPVSPTVPNQYGPPTVGYRYAGFWLRFVAVLIDALILGVIVWPIGGILAVMIGVAGGAVSMPGFGVHIVRGIVVGTLFFAAGWIYEATLESSSKQATLGKMALGLKVTDEQGQRISFARASARFFSKILSRMILMIGYVMAGFTARKQALHDIIAGTLVIRAQ